MHQDIQNHSSDPSSLKRQEEPPLQPNASPPANPGDNGDEKEVEPGQDNHPLSSSVFIEVPNMQSSLELSTITGNSSNLQQVFKYEKLRESQNSCSSFREVFFIFHSQRQRSGKV